MLNATTVTVGSGKAIHWGNDCGTMCGAAHRNGFFTAPKTVKADEVTCKRCIKAMAARVETDHVEALEIEAQIEATKQETYREAVAAEFAAAKDELNMDDEAANARLLRLATGADAPRRAEWNDLYEGGGKIFRVIDDEPLRLKLRNTESGGSAWVPRSWVEECLTHRPEKYGEEVSPVRSLAQMSGRVHRESGTNRLVAECGVGAYPQLADLSVVANEVNCLDCLGTADSAGEVPNTVEAWEAYAERVKASRDAAEAEVAAIVEKLRELATYWERRSAQGQPLPNTPWTALRAIVAEVGR